MRSPGRLLSIALLLGFLPAAAFAQNQARMSGEVEDHEGNPVKDAIVRLEPQDDKGALVEAKTKKKGTYLIGLIRPGAYKLAVEAPDGLVVLRLVGNAIDPTQGKTQLWEVDSEFPPDQLPPINVGPFNQIRLDVVVGPVAMTSKARAEAAALQIQDAYSAGLAMVKNGDFEGALARLEPLLTETPEHTATHYLVAFARTQIGRYSDALPEIDQVLALDPSFAGARVLKARTLRGLGRNEEAEQEFLAEIESTADASIEKEALIGLSILYEETDRLPLAISTLEKASESDAPRDVLLKLADLLAKAGEREKAVVYLERAEKEGGMDDVALLNLAIGYINDKNYEGAERLASRLIEKGSEDRNLSIAHSILARCKLNQGKLDDGATHLKKALELDPESSLATENQEILTALGR